MTATPIDLMRAAMQQMDMLLQMPEAERAALLNELTKSQPQLHVMVVQLLKAERDASGSGFLEPLQQANTTSAIKPDSNLGPYRIIRKLGAGGMGEVWLARRADGLYEGNVAIKTLHPHLANTAVRERFTREAHILGKLTHKNIARLHDAGVSETGVTYLVLEYVQGETLDAWCDARALPIRARLELFLSVCSAVAHAHAHLVVHRDLKPSNILVAQSGGVKLLDFGVAKLVQGDESNVEPTALTQFGGRIFTPEYAAPEQILGEAVTTATDVYALGLLLYGLLSGKRPFGLTGATGRELERAILNAEPFALATLPSDLAEKIARQRSTTPSKLTSVLKGDLEFIVARALRKSPKDRYGSVLALAVDIERYLQQQPIEAREGSGAYRLGRLVQRHRATALATVISITALLAGSTLALWQAQVARTEARKATAVKNFLLDIFNANSERHPEGVRARQTTAEELLEVASQKILESTGQEPEVRAELMGTLGHLNMTLDRHEQAGKMQRERIDYLTNRYGTDDRRLADPLVDLGRNQRMRGDFEESAATINRAIGILNDSGDHGSLVRGRAEYALADAFYNQGIERRAAAIDQFLKAIRILEKLPPSDELVGATLGLARAYELSEQQEDALAANRSGVELALAVNGPRDINVGGGHQQMGRVLAKLYRLPEAEEHFVKAIEVFSFTTGPEGGYTLAARQDAASMMQAQGKHRQVTKELEDVLAIRLRINGPAHVSTQSARFLLASSLLAIGDFTRARTLADEAGQALARTQNQNSLPGVLRTKSIIAFEQKRLTDALTAIDRSWQVVQKGRGPRSLLGATILATRGDMLVANGRLAEGRSVLEQSASILKEIETDPAHQYSLTVQLGMVSADLAQGKHEAARMSAAEVIEKVSKLERRKDFWSLEETAHRRLADAEIASGNAKGSCPSLYAAITLRESNALPSDPRLVRTRGLQKKHCTT